jgi:hypothetical protein
MLGCGEENRANGVEVALFNHALHENGADHSAPTDKTNVFHMLSYLGGFYINKKLNKTLKPPVCAVGLAPLTKLTKCVTMRK